MVLKQDLQNLDQVAHKKVGMSDWVHYSSVYQILPCMERCHLLPFCCPSQQHCKYNTNHDSLPLASQIISLINYGDNAMPHFQSYGVTKHLTSGPRKSLCRPLLSLIINRDSPLFSIRHFFFTSGLWLMMWVLIDLYSNILCWYYTTLPFIIASLHQ